MRLLQKFALAIVLITLLASCQSNSEIKEVLSNPDTRKEIMDSIAHNSDMSKEMMTAMMNSKNNKMMMEGDGKMSMMMANHDSMMKMMKDNPAMMHKMMLQMIEVCNTDTGMMSSMCKTMMGNPQMMEMMKKMKGKNSDMNKMKGMDKMGDKSHY